MASPTRRKGSDNWYYRRTIPADVRAKLERLPMERRPRGWYKTHISISKPGHLFCDVGKDGTTAGPADGVYSRIREAVGEVVTDPRVQPNHAWRYTFKSYAHEAGLNDFTADAICGHAGRTKGEDYRKVTLKTRVEFMAAFPRYRLDDLAQAAE